MLDLIGLLFDLVSFLMPVGLRSAAGTVLGIALDFGLVSLRTPKTHGEFVILGTVFFVCFFVGCGWDYRALKHRERDSPARN